VTIPNSVTSIGNSAFFDCAELKNVVIPQYVCDSSLQTVFPASYMGITNVVIQENVTSVGDGAFMDCGALTSVTIPNTVVKIGNSAFSGCQALASVHITDIAAWCQMDFNGSAANPLRYAHKLYINGVLTEELEIPNGVTNINPYVFFGYSGLTDVAIPNSIISIGDCAFSGCTGLKSVAITDIASWCQINFSNSSANPLSCAHNLKLDDLLVSELLIPDGIKSIKQYAFFGCSGLVGVMIPDSVMIIEECAFAGCSGLVSVVIPDSVTSIGRSAFSGCSGLEEIALPFVGALRGNNGTPDSLFGYMFGTSSYLGGMQTRQRYSAYESSYYYIPSKLKKVVITDETVLGIGAFDGCSMLTSVTMPNSVTNVGDRAFSGCRNVVSLTASFVPSGMDPAQLTHVTIPYGIMDIVHHAFYGCSGLTSMIIPNGVTNIGASAFEKCSGLRSVTIPASVTSIGSAAFSDCGSLVSFIVADDNPAYVFDSEFLLTKDGATLVKGCCVNRDVVIPEEVVCIGEYAFSGCGWLTNVTISGMVKSIGSGAFSGCDGLVNVTIPSGVMSIGDGAFIDCKALKCVFLPIDYHGSLDNLFPASTTVIRYIKLQRQTVVFDTNGGNVLDVTKIVDYGVAYGSLPLPSRVGYTFRGWSWNGQLMDAESLVAAVDDHELVAQWIANQYEIVFNANGGDGSVTNEQDYASEIVAPKVTREGYTLLGWQPALLETVPASNTTYTAQWRINQYEVVFDGNFGALGESALPSVTNTQDYGSAIVMPEVSRTGYTFSGWQPEVDATVPASNVTYTAQWRVNQYEVAFHANGGTLGENALPGVTNIQDYGSAIVAPAVLREGYTFVGWSPEVDVTVPASNVTYTAQWKINQYEVAFDGNGGALGERALPSVTNTQEYGSAIVTPTATRDGYTFTGWEPALLETVPASNVTYMAKWRINQYEVAFEGNGGALGECALPSVTNIQEYGSATVAPMATRVGYTFAGWLPEVDTIVPASNVTYTAQWIINQYDVVFEGNGGALGESAQPRIATTQDYESAIVAPSATREWFTFAGWQPAVAATVPASNVTFTAQWRRWGDTISASKMAGKTMSQLYPSDYTRMTTVVLEEGITKLPAGFFNGCGNVEFVTWPSTLVEFGIDDLPTKIRTSLAYDENGFIVYNGWLLDYQNKDASSLVVPEGIVGIGAEALARMYDLETVNLPQSLKYIAEGAFREDTYLDNLVIPDGVEIIGDGAFEDCSFIQTMTLGNGIKSVGARAFAGCTQLSSVTFGEGLVEIGAEAFDGCWRMLSVSLPISVTNVASTAFNGCTSLTGVTVPTHGGKVSEWFAPVYSQIRDVTVPEGETEVCASMFEGCGSLQTVQMSDSITNIAARAFYGCSSLPEVRLPESLLTVGDEVFRNCSSLTAAALPENVMSIGTRAFQGCSRLSALTLPRGLESLPDYVFAGCSSLDSFVVPEAVTNLGNYIVSGYTTAIYYLGNAPAYGANVYGNASGSLKSYVILGTKGWDGRPNSRDIPASWNGRDILTWSANQFDVTFDANGGLFFPVVTNTYACEETTYTGYSLPPFEPVRKGMDFDGYWTEPGGGTRVFTSTRVLLTKPHTLYAHWKKGATIKVRFNACGGTVSPAEDDYVAERPYCELPVPVREHFAFAGWWTEASGGSRIEISSEVPKAAHELFAHWTPNRYTIRFHANNGTSATVDQYFIYGDTVTLRANTFSSSGNAFAGWALSEDGPAVYADGKTLADVAAIQDNVIHLYAVWVSTRYTVRFDSHGGVGRMENQTLVKDEAAALYGCAFTRTGYTFAGWAVSTTGGVVYGDGESVVNVYEKTGADVVLYAVWKSIAAEMCETIFGGSGVVSANDAWDTVVVITNDVSGTVEIPDNVGTVTIDLNGHNMVGDGGLGETALPGGPAIRIVKGDGEGDSAAQGVARLAIVDTSEGEKGQIAGGGESAGIEVAEDVAQGVHLDVDDAVSVLNGDGTAQWMVTFDAQGGLLGIASPVRPVEKGKVVGELPTPVRTGYSFAGWYTAANGGVRITEQTVVRSSVTYYAHWTAAWTVTFDAQGGSVTDGASGTTRPTIEVLVEKGTAIGTLPKPERKGYTFKGWYTAASGGTKIKTTTKIKKDVTYYAQWTANKYKIKFNANGGSGSMSTISATYGKNVTLTANAFKRTNYTFLGWATKKDATEAQYANKAKVKNLTATDGKTVTLYAVWKRHTYTVKFSANGGDGATVKQAVNCGDKTALGKNTFTRDGFVFAGWATKKDGPVVYKNKAKVTDLAKSGKSVTLYAVWKPAAWAVGTFKGKGEIGGKAANVTLTVASDGKISGKFVRKSDKKAFSFKADGFDGFYDGALRATTTLKYGSKTCSATIAVGQDEETGETVQEIALMYNDALYGWGFVDPEARQ